MLASEVFLAENVEEPFLPLHIHHTRSNNNILFSP